MGNMSPGYGAYKTLRGIYNPRYIALNLIAALVYYGLYKLLINIKLGLNAPLVLVPDYIVYILIFTSSVLLTFAVYVSKNRKRSSKIEGRAAVASGTVTTFAGGLVAVCGCTPSLTLGLFVTFLSVPSAYALNNFISVNQIPLFFAVIAINLIMITYYVNKLSKSHCKK